MTPPRRQLPPNTPYADVEVVDDYGAQGASGNGGSPFKPKKLLNALRRFWWIPLLTLILGISGGAAYVHYLPASYISTAFLREGMKVRLPESGVFAEDLQTFVGTQSELLRSPTLHDLTLGRIRATGTNLNIPLDKEGKPERPVVQFRQIPKSAVYSVSATGSEPNYTRIYLDNLVLAYLDYRRDFRQEVSGGTMASIAGQVSQSERDLREAHDAFTAYQRSNNLAIVQQEAAVAGAFLTQLQTRLADLEMEKQLLEVAALGTNAPTTEGGGATNRTAGWYQRPIGPSAGSAGSFVLPEVQTALREGAGLRAEQERLGRYLRPKHPKMVRLAGEIQRVDSLLEIYRRQNDAQFAAAREALQLRIEGVQASILDWQRKVIEANTKIADAEQIKQRIQRAQSNFDRLSALVQSVGISRNIDQDSMQVLERADPSKRSFRQEITGLALPAVGGLALGLAILALIAFRDDRFDTHNDLDEALGGGVVGQVPEIELPARDGSMPLLAMDDSRHMFAESYRSLRSALLYLSADARKHTILLVTSAAPGEGKSTVTVNLARTLAFGGSKVLLIDADLRRGRLHEVLHGQREPGLSDVLRQPDHLEAALQQNSLPNLSFMSGGSDVANPGDLLLSPHFPQVLATLRQRFDYVLIDSSPVFAADDASTIAAQVDGTLFVVRRGYSRSPLVREGLSLLMARQAKILGIVFNRADTSLRSYRYYKYAEYYGKNGKRGAAAR